MTPNVRWIIPAKVHWTSDSPLTITLNIEIVSEDATEDALESATEHPPWGIIIIIAINNNQ